MRMVGCQHSRHCDIQPEKFSEYEFMAEKWRCFRRTAVSKKKKKNHIKGSLGAIS